MQRKHKIVFLQSEFLYKPIHTSKKVKNLRERAYKS